MKVRLNVNAEVIMPIVGVLTNVVRRCALMMGTHQRAASACILLG
jgi:hypothetical protein